MNKIYLLIAGTAAGGAVALLPASWDDETVVAEAAAPVNTSDSTHPLPLHPSSEPSAAGADQGVLAGRVVESIQVPEYTYLRVEDASGAGRWAAIPKAEVIEGAPVTIEVDTKMVNFSSPSLKRTFDVIHFGTLVDSGVHAPLNPHAAGSPHGPTHSASTEVSAAPKVSAVPEVGPVAKASGPGGITIEQLFKGKHRLKGAPVRVRGVVVKSSKAMGKTFAHLRDGTGSEQRADHDLTVTVAEALAIGDEVTIEGNPTVDRDFGQGYRYDVIIEDATLVAKH